MLNILLSADVSASKAWLVVDILVTLAVALMMFVFFARRNSYRIAVIIAAYSIVYLALLILNMQLGIAQIAIDVLRFFNIFWIVALVEVYRSDLKILMSKLSRRQKVKMDYNTTDEELPLEIATILPVKSVERVRLDETFIEKTNFDGKKWSIKIGAKKIETFVLSLKK